MEKNFVWLVEQFVAGLKGEYLTEAMVVGPTETSALQAVLSLEDEWGITVEENRLAVFKVGPTERDLSTWHYHLQVGDSKVVVVGRGEDNDS